MQIPVKKQFPRLIDAVREPLSLENWYEETFSSDFTMEYHTHPQIEIMYCVHGQFDFVYKYDEKDDKNYFVTINQNCFILVNNGYYHKIANLAQTTKILNLEFIPLSNSTRNGNSLPPSAKLFSLPLEKLFASCSELKRIVKKDRDYYVFVDDHNVLSAMKEFIRQMSEDKSAEEKNLYTALLTNKLFLDMSRCVSPETHKKTGIIYVDSAMMYINTHFLGKITVGEISKAVGISSVYLQKLFKLQYGKTIHEVITEKRVMQAKHLLEQTNLGVSEIAKQCGFGSREILSYEFQKCVGISPSKHRKSNNRKTIRFFSHYGETKLSDD